MLSNGIQCPEDKRCQTSDQYPGEGIFELFSMGLKMLHALHASPVSRYAGGARAKRKGKECGR
jgi:hypothetical protein